MISHYNRALAYLYFVLSFCWLIYGFFFLFLQRSDLQNTSSASFGALGAIVIALFGLMHLKASKNIDTMLRNKFFVLFSTINVLVIILLFLFGTETLCYAEGCMIILPTIVVFVVTSILTLLLGIFTLFQVTARILFWILFLIICIGVFLFIMDDLKLWEL
jgi:hypothetical protein